MLNKCIIMFQYIILYAIQIISTVHLSHAKLPIYDQLYTFPVETIDGNEDGFISKTQFSGTGTEIIMNGYVNESYMGVVDPNTNCNCKKYASDQYVVCYDPNYCMQFPRYYSFPYKNLKITATNIQVLRINDLGSNNSHLEILMIDGNKDFYQIQPGAFYNMSNLRNVSISYSPKLKHLHPDTFFGCSNIHVLALVGNGFTRFSDFTVALSPYIVPTLRKLRVFRNEIQNVSREDFDIMAGINLQTLIIVACNVTYFDPDILIPLYNLTALQIVHNELLDTNILDLFNKIAITNMTLHKFSLSGFQNVPEQILEAMAKTKISRLSLGTSNKFEFITEFPRMPSIEYLDLREVHALNITPSAFKKLTGLKTLLLGQNNLHNGNLSEAVLLENLENLDISDNTEFENYLLNLDLRIFTKFNRLKYLNISLNNIRYIEYGAFAGLIHLKVLDIENCKIFTIDNNSFTDLINLEYLDLRNNAIKMYPDIYNGLINLKVIILSKCGIKTIREHENIFQNMPKLQYLILDNNKIERIHQFLFKPLVELRYLELSNNELRAWEFRVFPSNNNLRTVNMYDNCLGTFTQAMVQDMKCLEDLNVRDNRYTCTCTNFLNVSKIMTDNMLSLLSKHSPMCTTPDKYIKTKIVDYIKELNASKCDLDLIVHASIAVYIIPSGIIFAIAVIVLIIIYFYRFYFRYYLFVAKLALNGSGSYFRERFKVKRSYKYDAFISYCNEDIAFVSRVISMLENEQPFLKLCVYDRDFKIGTVISESVLESIANSRRTLLVISDKYIRSQWCLWEVQVAENHRIFFEDEYGRCVNDTLIMIKFGSFSTDTIVSPMLKYLMKTRIYLEWEQDYRKQILFWKKLRIALDPPNKMIKKI